MQKFDGFNEFSVFCNVNYVFGIILQILVGNTPVLVSNFIIPVLTICNVLQVPSVYLTLERWMKQLNFKMLGTSEIIKMI